MRICHLAAVAAVACLLTGSTSWGQTTAGYRSTSAWSARSTAYSHSHLWNSHCDSACGCEKAPVCAPHCGAEPACGCDPCCPRFLPRVLNGIGKTLDRILICNKCCKPTCCDKPAKTCCEPVKSCCSKPLCSCDKGCTSKGCDCGHHDSNSIPQHITPPSPFLDEELPPMPPRDARRTYPNWSTPSTSRSNTPTPARVIDAAPQKTAAETPTSAAPQRLSVNQDMSTLMRKAEPEARDASVVRRASADSDVRSSGARSSQPSNPLR